jgi:putative redox protein
VFPADEPSEYGGKDAGPDSHGLLLAALGACAGITVQMYADRKQWPLEGVYVVLSYAKVPAEDRADSDTMMGMVDGIEMRICFAGLRSEGQQTQIVGDSRQMSSSSHVTSPSRFKRNCLFAAFPM